VCSCALTLLLVATERFDRPGDLYTFFISDFPHAIKKIVNAIEQSSKSSSARDLKIPAGLEVNNEPFFFKANLKMLQDVWEKYSACSFSGALQRERKLTYGHFVKNAFTRMRVYLSMQILSTSMVRIIDATAKDASPAVEGLEAGQAYEGVRALCEKLNRLIDIMNSTTEKDDIEFINAPDHRHLDELMETLAWFYGWKSKLASCNSLTDKERKSSFFPDECWADLQSLVLGFVCASKFYLNKYPGKLMIARRCSQDIVEHHFAHVRASRKSGSAVDATQALAATGAAAARRANGLSRGSHRGAPAPEGGAETLWFKK
jgi:hypothetical protein